MDNHAHILLLHSRLKQVSNDKSGSYPDDISYFPGPGNFLIYLIRQDPFNLVELFGA